MTVLMLSQEEEIAALKAEADAGWKITEELRQEIWRLKREATTAAPKVRAYAEIRMLLAQRSNPKSSASEMSPAELVGRIAAFMTAASKRADESLKETEDEVIGLF